MLGDVFGHDDPEIDHHTDRDRDAGEAHDVGPDAEQVHDQKGEEHAQGQAHGDRQACPYMQEKSHDHEDRGDDRLLERRRHRRGGLMDELRTVIEGNRVELLAFQGGLEVQKPLFDGGDHRLRVFLHAHPDDGADMLLITVRQQTLPELATEPHVGDVTEAQPCALRAIPSDDDVLHVLGRADEADAADHGLDPGLLDAHRAHIAAGRLHGHHEHLQGDALFLDARGIHINLVFAHDATGGRHLRDSGHGPQRGDDDLVEDVALRLDIPGTLQGEGIDLAHRRGIRAEPGRHAGGEDALKLGEPLEYPRAALVEVAAFLKNDVDVAGPIERHAPHSLHARQALQFPREPRRDLLVHVLGAFARPFRPDDDLVVAQVGNRIDRHMAPGPETGDSQRDGRDERKEGVADDEG